MKAYCMLRSASVYRREVFCSGLAQAGYAVMTTPFNPSPDDVLLIWNRYGQFHAEANRFEKNGARVLVTENGYMRDGIGDGKWYALAIGHHNGAGHWRVGGPERWDALNVEMQPWHGGNDVVIFAQRGIGENGIASPRGWAESVQKKYGGRIRAHPGNNEPAVPLADDLKNARAVLTWHSTAALYALMYGVPVFYAFPQWIGALASLPLSKFVEDAPCCDSAARLNMFRRIIWAQWHIDEIADGTAFRHLLR